MCHADTLAAGIDVPLEDVVSWAVSNPAIAGLGWISARGEAIRQLVDANPHFGRRLASLYAASLVPHSATHAARKASRMKKS
ncbi:hypothetical protein SPF06_18925 [Sinomonas sp. JGH33]|uniref:Uncharacterized protein n=1 Tax=Sinomonas terricola TaxID=3110330 RepID=A0ABU5TCK8_9MICC|nr:hypothetical protein [Sinomonas sp. JGH33]MEA5456801.1 hypothetical protein [Sinomonas sp. JGH33]